MGSELARPVDAETFQTESVMEPKAEALSPFLRATLSRRGMFACGVLFFLVYGTFFQFLLVKDNFKGFFDQSKYLQSVEDALNGIPPKYLMEGWHGAGYIAVAKGLARLLHIGADDSLMVLNLLSFWGMTCIVYLFVKRRLEENNKQSVEIIRMKTSMYCLTFLLGTAFVEYLVLPFSQFFAAFLFLSLIYLFSVFERTELPKQRQIMASALVGGIIGLTLQVRLFEGMGAIGCTALFFAVFAYLRRPSLTRIGVNVIAGAVALLAVYVFCLWYVGLHGVHLFYYELDRIDPRTTLLLKMDPLHVPLKFVQIFLLPSFFNLEYQVFGSFFPWGDRAAYLPMLLQLPIFIVFLLSPLVKKGLNLAPVGRIPFTLAQWTAVFAAVALTTGYLASSMIGPGHLPNGLIRDFAAPAWCLAFALGPGIINSGKWKTGTEFSKHLFWPLLLLLMVFMIKPISGFVSYFRIESLEIDKITADANCIGRTCDYNITLRTKNGTVYEDFNDKVVFGFVCLNVDTSAIVKEAMDVWDKPFTKFRCEYPFFKDCDWTANYTATYREFSRGRIELPKCELQLLTYVYLSTLGNGHLPQEQRQAILLQTKFN